MSSYKGTMCRLLAADGSWDSFRENWRHQCVQQGDDFESYGITWLSVFEEDVASDMKNARVYTIEYDGAPHAAFHANWTQIKGHKKEILRVRHLVLSPDLDYGTLPRSDYAIVLQGIISGVLDLADSELPADHIRIHLKSPSDIPVFSAFGSFLASSGVVKEAAPHGSWIFLDK